MKNTHLPSTRSGFALHACDAARDSTWVHALYRPARWFKGAAGSQIWQRGAVMPDRLAPLLAATDLVVAMFGMFSAQNRTRTNSRRPHTEAGGRRKRTHTAGRFSVAPRFKPLQAV